MLEKRKNYGRLHLEPFLCHISTVFLGAVHCWPAKVLWHISLAFATHRHAELGGLLAAYFVRL